MWTTGRCRRCSAIGFIQPVPARSFLGLSRVCLNWHVGLKCKPTHGFIPWMSPLLAQTSSYFGLSLERTNGLPSEETASAEEVDPYSGSLLWGWRSSWLYEPKLQLEVRRSCRQSCSPEAPSRHKHPGPAPSPGALPAPLYRGKRGLLAENNLAENGVLEPSTVSPSPLPSSSMSLPTTRWHVLSPSPRAEAGPGFKGGSD